MQKAGQDWSNGTTAEDATGFGEYCNLNSDGTEFKSSITSKQLTATQYNSIVATVESDYLGNWTPAHYVSTMAVNNSGSIGAGAINNVKIK